MVIDKKTLHYAVEIFASTVGSATCRLAELSGATAYNSGESVEDDVTSPHLMVVLATDPQPATIYCFDPKSPTLGNETAGEEGVSK